MNRWYHSMLVTVALWAVGAAAHAQVAEINLAQLESRLANGGDTTFVVNFWATWCKPCVEELPAFDRLQRSAPPLVKVLLVSLDTPSERTSKVEPFVRRRNLSAEVVLLNEAKPHLWIDRIDPSWSGAIPCTLIVNTSRSKRAFFEREFNESELRSTLSTFLTAKP